MKKTFFKAALALVLVCASVFCFASCGNSAAKVEDAQSANGSFAGVSWDYNAKDKTLTIKGSGAINFSTAAKADWINVRHSVEKIVFDTAEITEIGNYAFYNMKSLKEIDIPDSVTVLGNYAFAYCASLTNIDGQLPAGLTSIGESCFESCIKLEAITVPANVHTIGTRAFAHCSSLKTVDIDATLDMLEAWTFKGCTSLEKLTMYEANKGTIIDPTAFEDCAVSGISEFSKTIGGKKVLTINYVYEDGSQAAEPYVEEMVKNEFYEKASPAIEGYQPDVAVVKGNLGEDKEITVVYTKIVEQTEAVEENEQTETQAPVTEEPKSKTGNIIALVFMGVVILAIVGLVVFMAISNKKNSEKNNKNNKNNKNKNKNVKKK